MIKMAEFFVVTRTCKDDMKGIFRNNQTMLKKIEELTDTEMEYIAGKLADDYCNQLYWESLRIIVEDYLTRDE